MFKLDTFSVDIAKILVGILAIVFYICGFINGYELTLFLLAVSSFKFTWRI